jgi:hypothetical protein
VSHVEVDDLFVGVDGLADAVHLPGGDQVLVREYVAHRRHRAVAEQNHHVLPFSCRRTLPPRKRKTCVMATGFPSTSSLPSARFCAATGIIDDAASPSTTIFTTCF